MIETETYSDELLTQGIRQGNEASFTAAYKRYWKILFYQAEAILEDELLAQDCVQEVFTALWRRREEVKVDHLLAYLKTSIRYQAASLIRSRIVRRDYFNRILHITSQLITYQPTLFNELNTLFQEAIRSLPSDQQEIFRLIREEGHTYREVAELKGISVKTVEKKMTRSLKDLRLKLGEYLHLFLL
jgi:RNA polymerase sigma-70 factor (family 1)